MNLRIYEFFRTLINMVLTIISFFLILRIILAFFSTNPATPFVEWVFSVSQFFMTPFAGIAPSIRTQMGLIDTVAIISLVVYFLVAYLLQSLTKGLTTEPTMIEEEYPSTSVHYHDLPRRERVREEYRRDSR